MSALMYNLKLVYLVDNTTEGNYEAQFIATKTMISDILALKMYTNPAQKFQCDNKSEAEYHFIPFCYITYAIC